VDTIEHGTRITETDIELFLKHGATLVATFNPYMRPTTLAPGRPPDFVAGVPRAQENIRRVFPAFFRSGAKFTVGSDSSHGNFVFEVEMLGELGLTPLQAISACTRQAADALGILDRAGSLEPGKWADVIAVRGNPLEDISALREVEFVMKAGVRMELSPL
jgi:imidazolonepropionase-like amidohydrolase